jgi:hypothetical protein
MTTKSWYPHVHLYKNVKVEILNYRPFASPFLRNQATLVPAIQVIIIIKSRPEKSLAHKPGASRFVCWGSGYPPVY